MRFVQEFVLVVFVSVLLAGCGGGDRPEVVATADKRSGESAVPGMDAASESAGVVVDVAGAVRRPGVYRLEPGARVHEAIAAAGGARAGAELGALNRAAVVQDGQQVLVLTAAEVADPTAGGANASGAGAVNVNTADAAALDELPGIGEVTAAKIVAERESNGPFASIDDLDRVPGIGPTMIESLREVVIA